ncbi:FlaA1/EpsC-like NDP-sugar epimerase [Aequitasia blattaphilus]|uniref:Polysaccharide biosynthesis protein n=1 Tax=Aequitasia blattaphilus TaxID=2949332 RepID=A0ABT1E600_9FIRM|nr:nucleoside-diphosphate sugar epimerase/dehydratase [Aequitasia blattaphilus]MCP1101269.1 polysaccharide biosynthesis protein [Aequitasia blattaphilus]MCR8613909.1 polysaccharide biosynthesis protein [Aequitasia blattaphilus]
MERLLSKVRGIDLSVLYKFILLGFDIIFINFSSALGLLLRFNLQLSEIPEEYYISVTRMAGFNTAGTILIFALCRLYSSLWRFAGMKEFFYVIKACVASVLLNILMYYLGYQPIYRSYFILYGTFLFIFTIATRFAYRVARTVYRKNQHGSQMRNTMIIGAGEASNVVINELEQSGALDAKICCIIDDNPKKQGNYIRGIKVIGGRDMILDAAKKYNITEIVIAIPSAQKKEVSQIIEICQKTDCELKILPGVYQLVNGEVTVSKIRNVEIEDLLGRDPIQITSEKIGRYVSDKVVLITGGGGSIGSELCRQIAANGPRQLIIFDVYENNAYDIQQELKQKYENLDLVVLIGSVRNSRKLNKVFAQYRPDIVYHAAAHKHVPLMEDSPNEAVKNNVFGTYKTALAADRYGVEKFVLISTDKAVNPTNIMGATKRMCEMIIQIFGRRSQTEYVAVRFGNVLGSNGSVIPLFKKQIEEGGPVTVTHPDIIRYFMTIPEAVSLVLEAGASAKGGEIFVLDMGKPVKIVDLARNLISLSGYTPEVDIEIKYTGLRPGEKLYEEILMDEEGLEETENSLIHIGKPLDFDEEEFLRELEKLYALTYAENPGIKQIISRLVPTYTIKGADIERDKKISDKLNREYSDTNEKLPQAFLNNSHTLENNDVAEKQED